MKITIAGTGYVGLVTGVVLAEIGHDVTCIDIDEKKVELMRTYHSPIYEDGLEELMIKNKNRLHYTTDFKTSYANADAIYIGVGTPERADGSANLDYVMQVCKEIAVSLQHECVVVVKSTVPIKTNDIIERYLNANTNDGIRVHVASNPEFLSQGTAVHDTLHSARIVIGVEDEYTRKVLEKVYEPLTKEPYSQPLLFMNRKSAEMVKYASNDFLALKISYINEIANFCEIVGANIEDVAKGMGYDQRIGNRFLNPGIGYGGSCFPKDTKALYSMSKQLEVDLLTVKAAIEVNKKQKIRLSKMVLDHFGESLQNLRIACLGVTFKPGTDDLREAASIENVRILLDYGANIAVYDPIGLARFKEFFQGQINYCENIEEALAQADCCLIFTEWKEIKSFNIDKFSKLMKQPIVFDGRNCYKISDMEKARVLYKSIGRPIINTIDRYK